MVVDRTKWIFSCIKSYKITVTDTIQSGVYTSMDQMDSVVELFRRYLTDCWKKYGYTVVESGSNIEIILTFE